MNRLKWWEMLGVWLLRHAREFDNPYFCAGYRRAKRDFMSFIQQSRAAGAKVKDV
jgi:hypothetical protein